MTFRRPQKLLPPDVPWFDPQTGRPTVEYQNYAREIDALIREYVTELIPVTVATLPATAAVPQRRYASDGRKAGEGAGNGTGVWAFWDGTIWAAVDTGAEVEA